MKRILLTALAVLSAGLLDHPASAAEPVNVPAPGLPISLSQDVSVNQVYVVRRPRRWRRQPVVWVDRYGRRHVRYRRSYY